MLCQFQFSKYLETCLLKEFKEDTKNSVSQTVLKLATEGDEGGKPLLNSCISKIGKIVIRRGTGTGGSRQAAIKFTRTEAR